MIHNCYFPQKFNLQVNSFYYKILMSRGIVPLYKDSIIARIMLWILMAKIYSQLFRREVSCWWHASISRFIFCRSVLYFFCSPEDNEQCLPTCLPSLPGSVSPESDVVRAAVLRLAKHLRVADCFHFDDKWLEPKNAKTVILIITLFFGDQRPLVQWNEMSP